MKNALPSLLLCGSLSCCALAPSALKPQDAAAQGFKIAGTVVNAITGAPLARAKVTVADTRYRARQIATQTDESGHFEFAGLPAGKYGLQGSRAGYLLSSYEQHEQYSTAIVTGPEFQTDHHGHRHQSQHQRSPDTSWTNPASRCAGRKCACSRRTAAEE
jgi:hypothetical protein